MKFLIALFVCLSFFSTKASSQNEGFAVIKNDTIYGKIRINFTGGSVIIKQDSINRMFIQDIKVVTLLNETRDTYYTYVVDGKSSFYKAVILGENLLIEKDKTLYCVYEGSPTAIEEKILYNLFGKKAVKEYAFIRNISLSDREGQIDLFSHFNNFNDY